MSLTIVHNRVDTQEDDQTVLNSGGVCPSHWNDEHGVTGTLEASNVTVTTTATLTDADAQAALESMGIGIRGLAVIDMGGTDYTMTLAESQSPAKAILNGGSGNTLTYPTTSDGKCPSVQAIYMAFTSDPVYLSSETYGGATLINAPFLDIIVYTTITSIQSTYSSNISDAAYGGSWENSTVAPTQNAVYNLHTAIAKDYTQSFLLMGG